MVVARVIRRTQKLVQVRCETKRVVVSQVQVHICFKPQPPTVLSQPFGQDGRKQHRRGYALRDISIVAANLSQAFKRKPCIRQCARWRGLESNQEKMKRTRKRTKPSSFIDVSQAAHFIEI